MQRRRPAPGAQTLERVENRGGWDGMGGGSSVALGGGVSGSRGNDVSQLNLMFILVLLSSESEEKIVQIRYSETLRKKSFLPRPR